ncbi:MAG: succinyl transferase OpgC, partial [Rhodobacteraceae bacterium]|nr:succinyl transferase OpgC [Paracoccaceae bacterium]
YLAWVVAGEGGARLVAQGPSIPARAARLVLTLILKVGQQSLAVFVVSMLLARLMGFALDYLGRSAGTVAAINLAGFAVLIGVAYGAGWFKTHPWRQKTG